jgi:hypothetical protein
MLQNKINTGTKSSNKSRSDQNKVNINDTEPQDKLERPKKL